MAMTCSGSTQSCGAASILCDFTCGPFWMRRRSIQDRASGPFWYRRPADPWQDEWEQIRLGEGVDAIAAIDVDDGRAEVIAQRGGGETLNLAWLQAQQASAGL
ncbi:hypothetical protein L2449_15030 [Mesorhizobium muleiense]|uniref:hypothetical protein n=1 Tax=Mesorhizobium muleiense TaxID=1004279 RepID=UPI001F1E8877|nr:hypothetical protein [Mesorhizobium muleiense]MCF6118189.1 hypothetical protein [Mesorhizobium muleiense]